MTLTHGIKALQYAADELRDDPIFVRPIVEKSWWAAASCRVQMHIRKSRKLAFRLQLELFFRKSSRGLGVVWAPIAICGCRCVPFLGLLGAWCTVLRDAGVGYSVVDFVCVHSALCGAFFGARCAFLGSFLGFWAPFWCTVRLFGFDFGALPFRDRFWCVVR